MAEEATKANKSTDDIPPATKPYDKQYYGTLSDIEQFKKGGHALSKQVLMKAGGRFISMG